MLVVGFVVVMVAVLGVLLLVVLARVCLRTSAFCLKALRSREVQGVSHPHKVRLKRC